MCHDLRSISRVSIVGLVLGPTALSVLDCTLFSQLVELAGDALYHDVGLALPASPLLTSYGRAALAAWTASVVPVVIERMPPVVQSVHVSDSVCHDR